MGSALKHKVDILWSSNLAYGLGLITSDGCLHRDGRHISFASKDFEIISKFKSAFALTNKIGIATKINGVADREWFHICFGDKSFYNFLLTIGLSPAKSKIIERVDIPDQFFPDFLRGLFDGDGTFYTYWDTRWPNSFCFKASFASASPVFIRWLKNRLSELYGLKGSVHKGAGVENLEYTKGDSRRLFEVMYHTREEVLFFSRKYNKMKSALEKDVKLGILTLQKHRLPR